MRVARLKVAGFRGIRSDVDIEFPPGFTVISGRNGAGKTSICDAIEFALTGGIKWREDETERRERIGDYVWWRGKEGAHDHYVELVLVDEGSGRKHKVRRDPEGLKAGGPKLEELLTDASKAPAVPIERICETAVVRDEEITELSIESAERERYRMVKEAVGSPLVPRLRSRCEKLAERVDGLVKRASEIREERQKKVNALLERRSELAGKVEGAQEIAEAMSRLEFALGKDHDEDMSGGDIAAEGRKLIASLQSRRQTLKMVKSSIVDSMERREELKAQKSALKDDLASKRDVVAECEEKLETAEQALQQRRAESPNLSLLTDLEVAGSELGLKDGSCPLCGSEIQEDDFQEHLKELRSELREHRDVLSRLSEVAEEAREEYMEAVGVVEGLESELHEVEDEVRRLDEQRNRVMEDLNNVEAGSEGAGDEVVFEAVEDELSMLGAQIPDLETAVERVEASTSVAELEEVEESLKKAREKVAEAEREYEATKQASGRVEATERILKRYEGQIVNERLHSLRPLLQELYLRLRPHVDWREVDYELRGDVQRFLSLKVGDDLNPRFMFSSGQRRASGLAFLFAVYLGTSSSWSEFRSLVLDDPIQHIDDYRAIQLVEVLASIRGEGHQLVVTVEDTQLAQLLCRRLNIGEKRGSHVRLEYEPGGGCRITSTRTIVPISDTVFEAG
jgi:DNA repair exonuclease SbcCD ATPase subunit